VLLLNHSVHEGTYLTGNNYLLSDIDELACIMTE